MPASAHRARPSASDRRRSDLAVAFAETRRTTQELCLPLGAEDCAVQSMPDASPAKWHLAHTTWFFERFVLCEFAPGYEVFDDRYDFLFNSYYDAVGPRQPRAERGLLSRPTLDNVRDYRAHVDGAVGAWLETFAGTTDRVDEALLRIELGCHHEQQHQELLLTDIKHAFFTNPLRPAYHRPALPTDAGTSRAVPLRWQRYAGGLHEIGAGEGGFAFDNERPRHRVYVEPFEIAQRLVTNGDYLEFIRDGGYERADLWLAEGWAQVQAQRWQRPLYWSADLASEFTLAGDQPLQAATPVCHVSYYEADAFARWAGARLPTEAEWELAARTQRTAGNLLGSGWLHPRSAQHEVGLQQAFGDVWEWTSSPYAAYPGFRAAAGALGEYNGKFMVNQLVLRGGSCATPTGHVRPSYRNFFHPHQRWQFMGLRLAREAAPR